MTFCQILKVLYSVDAVLPFGKVCTVLDAQVTKLTDIQCIIVFITICINDVVRLYMLKNNRRLLIMGMVLA